MYNSPDSDREEVFPAEDFFDKALADCENELGHPVELNSKEFLDWLRSHMTFCNPTPDWERRIQDETPAWLQPRPLTAEDLHRPIGSDN